MRETQTTASFGQWLKQHRKALDLTQEELADRIGCSYVAIRKMEAGSRRPSRQMAELLADLFEVPANERETFIGFARGIDGQAEQTEARSGRRVPGNLPAPLTPLIGRDAILATLCDLLAQDARLLTLTGAPGIGKTRLSIQVATDMLGTFPDGVWLIELAPLVDAKLVASTVAYSLGLKEAGNTPILETLKSYLEDKHLLLVLDNFEHVMDAAEDVSQLLASDAGVRILATSRVPLRVRGEREYSVPPLSVPDPEHLPALEQLAQYEAVRLFTERAQAVKADFELTGDNAHAVAEICLRLDGLPLAIELASARVKMLPPQALLPRLSQRLKLLTGGPRDLAIRQQTLRGAIDWSYDLLSDGEKLLFRRMAVFQGGRTLEALEAVCNSEGSQPLAKPQVDTLDGVHSLLDKSLLQRREGSDGEPRFWMLETLHEYAREKLQESGEEEALERAHALYFMKLADEAEPHLTGAKQGEWLNRLEDDYDNLRAVLRWARAVGGGEGDLSEDEKRRERIAIGLRTAGAIWRFWDVRGHYSEGSGWLEGLLALPGLAGLPGSTESAGALEGSTGQVQSVPAIRAKLLSGAGLLADKQGHYSVARRLYEESLALRRELGDKEGIAGALNDLGVAAGEHGDFHSAQSLFEESLALKRELGDMRGIAGALNNLGNLAYGQEDYTTARSLYEESLALKRELGDMRGIANTLQGLASVAQEQGDHATARSLNEESLALKRELGDKSGVAYSLNNLGNLAQEQGNFTLARSLQAESLALRKEIGHKWMVFSLSGLGEVTVAASASMADMHGVARGARVLGAVEAILESMGIELPKGYHLSYERATASARSQLGDQAFERAWQEGRAMSLEQAVAYALQDTNTSVNA